MISLLLTSALMILSFNKEKTITYYSYQGVTVTRIDGEGESTFFYGKIKSDTAGHPNIKAKYCGIQNDLNVAIHFKTDGIVEIISLGEESFTLYGLKDKIHFADYRQDNTDWEKLLHQPNIIRASSSSDYETGINIFYKTKVLVEKHQQAL